MSTQAEVRVAEKPQDVKGGPLSPDQIGPTLIMALIAALGGFVAFYQKVKAGNARAVNITELVGELVISSVCGVIAYWAFTGFGVNQWLTAAGVGMVGHMGSRAIFLVEQIASKWLAKKAGVTLSTSDGAANAVDRR